MWENFTWLVLVIGSILLLLIVLGSLFWIAAHHIPPEPKPETVEIVLKDGRLVQCVVMPPANDGGGGRGITCDFAHTRLAVEK